MNLGKLGGFGDHDPGWWRWVRIRTGEEGGHTQQVSHSRSATAMETARLALPGLVLLLIQAASGQANFGGLPVTVTLPESSAPGTLVYNFTLENCTSLNPKVTISTVSPASNFFNAAALASSGGPDYTVQITLSSSATLNARVVNQYTLDITGSCAGVSFNGQIFVMVTDDVPEPQCEEKFSSQVGDTVQVYANLPASSPVYKVVLRQPKLVPATFKITQPNPSPFTMSLNGDVLAPAAGFTNAARTFGLQIMVTYVGGKKCNGTLTVEVLPVYDNPVNFTVSSTAVTIRENGGPGALVTTVQAQGNNVLYEMITPSTTYYIIADTGQIRTTSNLDLEMPSTPAFTSLRVRAYDMRLRSNSAIITVNITVLDVNDMAPTCSPAVFVTQVSENTPINKKLLDLTCTDPDVNSTTLTYSVTPNVNSLYSFRMVGSQLLVNKTLTYDSAEIAAMNFQYSATIVVTDSGSPQLTTNIPVFVTVTPVNNYPPQCVGPLFFSVNENAPFDTIVGQVNATDADYKFNSVQFSIDGGNSPPVFYISPQSGEIHLLSSLDFEVKTSYQLKIKVVDLNNDIMPDPTNQKTTFCPITINVQDINDNPPICTPPYYRTTIYSTLITTADILTVTCTDKDISGVLSYTIVGGNTNNRFSLNGPSIRHNPFSYNPDGLYDPLTFELLIQVKDSPAPQFSTTATVFIRVIPWTTTSAATTSTSTTKERRIVTGTLNYWAPDTWFVAILTLVGVLLLIALALLTWKLAKGCPLCYRSPKEATQPLLQDRSLTDLERAAETAKQQPQSKEKKDVAPVSPPGLQFDGRAQDPVTGREYLFNSRTGERRWL